MKPPYQTVIDCMIDEPADVYHAQKNYLSSHRLIDFIKSPLTYHQKKLGIIADVDSAAYAFGRAVHTYILEGEEKFNAEYAVGGPINPKTQRPYGDQTIKFKEWAKEQGKPVVSFDDMINIQSMRAGFALNLQAVRLIGNGKAEGVIRANLYGLESQIRVDWLNPDEGLVDLKTTRDIDSFESDATDYKYFNQLAFYQEVIYTATALLVPVYVIAIEKKPPFRCGVWLIDSNELLKVSLENMKSIQKLQVCQRFNQWPSGYETMKTLKLK